MKITSNMLRRIILEEMRNVKAQKLNESRRDRTIKVTPNEINRIIREEYEAFQNRKRLAEARRLRKRRIAEARRRRIRGYWFKNN